MADSLSDTKPEGERDPYGVSAWHHPLSKVAPNPTPDANRNWSDGAMWLLLCFITGAAELSNFGVFTANKKKP